MRYAKQIKKSIILIILAIITTLHSSCFLDVFAIDKNNLAEYQGDIQFLSFETLMSFPEKALNDNNSYSTIYDEDKITTQEFENILEELYKNNYILVDIFDIVEKNNLTHKKLYLPQNKKPLVFIFNNATYKSNYQNLGQIDKIIIDRNNNLASYTTKKSIQDRIQHDNEFMLILENFINTHKDFSHNNARGIIFFSGENGILGYNTNSKNTSSKYEKKRVFEVIKNSKISAGNLAEIYTHIETKI